MSTAKRLSQYIDSTGRLSCGNGLMVGVKILDARTSFSRVQLLVTPITGSGQAWVDEDRVVSVRSNDTAGAGPA